MKIQYICNQDFNISNDLPSDADHTLSSYVCIYGYVYIYTYTNMYNPHL